MKKLSLLIAAFLVVTIGLSAQTIQFDSLRLDYGIVWSGADGTCDISFTNTGNAPLVISRSMTSDGGSYATYPKAPIMPGERGSIKIKYDTNRIGPFSRTLNVSSNDAEQPELLLRFWGEVRKMP